MCEMQHLSDLESEELDRWFYGGTPPLVSGRDAALDAWNDGQTSTARRNVPHAADIATGPDSRDRKTFRRPPVPARMRERTGLGNAPHA
jgi:hypothetical protein